MLIGYGAVAINPYLAYATIEEMINQGLLTDIEYDEAAKKYTKAVVKGVVKVHLQDGDFHHPELLRLANFRSGGSRIRVLSTNTSPGPPPASAGRASR